MKTIVEGNITIDDRTARLLCDMADRFYSNPENIKKYEQWHLQEYGCLPGAKSKKKKG